VEEKQNQKKLERWDDMTKILVVDDSLFMRKILKDILAELGQTDVIDASLGGEALDQFNNSKPDMVLLDIILPDMSGDEVLKKMMVIDPKVKVIVVTAIGQKSMMDECMKSGAKSYIVKPFDKEKVKAEIKKWA
jgi:two-component system chemotaxis response regulator CheY